MDQGLSDKVLQIAALQRIRTEYAVLVKDDVATLIFQDCRLYSLIRSLLRIVQVTADTH